MKFAQSIFISALFAMSLSAMEREEKNIGNHAMERLQLQKKALEKNLNWPKPKKVVSFEDSSGQIVTSAAFAPNGATLAAAVADDDGYTIKIWNARAPFALNNQLQIVPADLSFSLAYNADEILASGDRLVRIWDCQTGKLIRTAGEGILANGHIAGMQFSGHDKKLAINRHDSKEVFFWNPETNFFNKISDNQYIYGGCYSPDAADVYLTYSDQNIKLWDLRKPNVPQNIIFPGKEIAINLCGNPVVYNQGGTKFAVAAYKNRVYEYDAKSGKLLATLTGFGNLLDHDMHDMTNIEPQSLAYTLDDAMLIIGALKDNTTSYIIGADSNHKVAPHRILAFNDSEQGANTINSLVLNKEGTQMAAGSMSGSLLLWNIPGNDFKKAAVAQVLAKKQVKKSPEIPSRNCIIS